MKSRRTAIRALARAEPPGTRVGSWRLENALQRREAAHRRFAIALLEWEGHLRQCRACLGQGAWFCREGELLTEEGRRSCQRVERAQQAVGEAFEPFGSRTRRPKVREGAEGSRPVRTVRAQPAPA